MEILSESKKILLAKLKFRDPERYEKKLNLFGVSESELLEYIFITWEVPHTGATNRQCREWHQIVHQEKLQKMGKNL